VAQAYYNKVFGIKRLTTETGAGQWGSALSFATQFDRAGMQGLHGADQLYPEAVPQDHDARLGWQLRGQPEQETEVGRRILEEDPNTPGSLGIAISEALEQAVQREDTRYSLGSVLNHVMLHQTSSAWRPRSSSRKSGNIRIS
jgi:tryptophan synthase beta chain